MNYNKSDRYIVDRGYKSISHTIISYVSESSKFAPVQRIETIVYFVTL